jgi:hypothetical protein
LGVKTNQISSLVSNVLQMSSSRLSITFSRSVCIESIIRSTSLCKLVHTSGTPSPSAPQRLQQERGNNYFSLSLDSIQQPTPEEYKNSTTRLPHPHPKASTTHCSLSQPTSPTPLPFNFKWRIHRHTVPSPIPRSLFLHSPPFQVARIASVRAVVVPSRRRSFHIRSYSGEGRGGGEVEHGHGHAEH